MANTNVPWSEYIMMRHGTGLCAEGIKILRRVQALEAKGKTPQEVYQKLRDVAEKHITTERSARFQRLAVLRQRVNNNDYKGLTKEDKVEFNAIIDKKLAEETEKDKRLPHPQRTGFNTYSIVWS